MKYEVPTLKYIKAEDMFVKQSAGDIWGRGDKNNRRFVWGM